MDTIEYKVVELKEKGIFLAKLRLQDLEDQLNFFGDKGWELASSFTKDLDLNGKKEVILIFKRKTSLA